MTHGSLGPRSCLAAFSCSSEGRLLFARKHFCEPAALAKVKRLGRVVDEPAHRRLRSARGLQVWKKEQEKEKEERKLEELRKQIQEERDRDALLQQAEQGGHLERTARLDWMYMGGMQGQAAAQQREAEEARKEVSAGGRRVLFAPPLAARQAYISSVVYIRSQEQRAPLTHTEAPGKGSLPTLPSFYTAATPAAQNEMWQRMTNDPLVAIKQQEKAALERLRSNPVVMNRIKAEVAGALSPRAGSSAMASEKKEKKEKKARQQLERRVFQQGEVEGGVQRQSCVA